MIKNLEKRIYLVDPDTAIRDSIRAMLQSYGVEVRTYSSGRSFLNNAQLTDQDCILVENNLPDMIGIDLVENLKRMGINAACFILSSANDIGFEELVSSQDSTIVLRKPLQSKHLIEVINSL